MGNTRQNELDIELCSSLCNEMNVALMLLKYPSGEFFYVNKKVCEDLGASRKDIIGANYQDFFAVEFYQIYDELVEKCQDGTTHTTIYYWSQRAIWEQISARIVYVNDEKQLLKDPLVCPGGLQDNSLNEGFSPAILLNITNITEVARREREYELTAYFDSLTGLPNGIKLELDIAELDSVKDLSLIYFQINNFDDIVDPYGWSTGDQLYLAIRDWLIETESPCDQHYKGERGFIELSRGVTRADVIKRIEMIIERFKQPWTVDDGGKEISFYCKIDIGGVVDEYVREEVRALLVRTLKMSTRKGSEYTIYDGNEDILVKAKHKLKNELVNCIFDGMKGFSVCYQPIVVASTGAWIGLEALCRWQASSGELVPPAEFIPAVQQIGFMPELDSWVRKEALKQCSELGLNKKNFILDVNYSPDEPINDDFVDSLINDCRAVDFPPQSLIIEITESERMHFDEVNLKGLDALRRLGFRLSLDDFGTGYSSLELLFNIEASYLKTDKSLVDDLTQKERKKYLTNALINLAHHLDMKIVMEGVETVAQRDLLVKYGVDFIQGFLFSRPISAEQLAKEVWRFDDKKGTCC